MCVRAHKYIFFRELTKKKYFSSMKSNYTIADIAKLAGVSKGTVDRVLHKRGRVSKKAEDQVNKVLKEIDYQPNIMAKQLKMSRNYTVVCIIPDPKLDPYWAPLYQVIENNERPNPLKVEHKYIYFNPFDKESFVQATKSFNKSETDLVILTPIFYNESIFFILDLKTNEIPYITFNATTELSGSLSFIGQDLKKSGQLIGHLLQLLNKEEGSIVCFHILEDFDNTIHMKKKHHGLTHYFQKNQLNKKIISENIIEQDKSKIRKRIKDFILEIQPKGITVSNSMGYLVAECLKELNQKIPFIAYDLTTENQILLKQGFIDFIIEQNPGKQFELALQIAQDKLVFDKNVKSHHFFPLEIITIENC